MENQQSNKYMMIGGVVVFLVICVIGAGFFVKTFLRPAPSASLAPDTNTYSNVDVNKDGNINQLDIALIKEALGCQENTTCWDKVIGKTVNGDNPIYSSDMDLNKDSIVDQKDIDLIQTGI